MTVTHRKRQHQPEEIQTVNEPGLQIKCDGCSCELTHSIRIKCADPACEIGDGIDICPACFCAGKEFGPHKRDHPYRVVELHSYPIFSDDWGADEELLLVEGISLQGLGNWQAVAEHVGTRTKEEVEQHYKDVYLNSPNWPLPPMDVEFDVDPAEFQERKRRRIATMHSNPPPAPPHAPTSAPGVHEVATFLPGRLEFEHELDNEAEDLVKDIEFGVVLQWGGDEIPEDENDLEVKARLKWEEENKTMRDTQPSQPGKRLPNGFFNGLPNGYHPSPNGDTPKRETRSQDEKTENDDEEGEDEPILPPPFETEESLAMKLTMLQMYNQRVQKRIENKELMFERGLLNYKQMQAADKKRPREEKEVVVRLRPFAKLQTAEDFEYFVADILYEQILRKRIQELQHYRRMGLSNASDIQKYEADLDKRGQVKASLSHNYYSGVSSRGNVSRASTGPDARRADDGRKSNEREATPKVGGPSAGPSGSGPVGRRMPAPLNLANSPSLHLLSPEEQTLCSTLRILPKPYLVVKETLVREYSRRGGKLRRREARDLVKIDVNKTSRIWDFLVQSGALKVGNTDPLQIAQEAAA
ncbi:hypothetical protein K474DRAFT_1021973 [Panus rudis PR-1116 ss-1]|nr:hypothetical protein K474DRAFT_1021973 [Panus rudis PR-1116 ss-1]